MKEFHQWMSDMTNSIEDGSVVDKSLCRGGTPLQKRMYVADLVVPKTNTEVLINDWISVFCVTVYNGTVARTPLVTIVGKERNSGYYLVSGYVATAEWLKTLRQDILQGWMP